MKDILCIEDIVESTVVTPFLTPFLSTYSINMAEFVGSHKVVWINASAFTSEQNESVSKNEDIKSWSWKVEVFIFANWRRFGFLKNP
jgi:hypothetical protein